MIIFHKKFTENNITFYNIKDLTYKGVICISPYSSFCYFEALLAYVKYCDFL